MKHNTTFQPTDWFKERLINGINSYFNLLSVWLNIDTDEFSVTVCLLQLPTELDEELQNIEQVTIFEDSPTEENLLMNNEPANELTERNTRKEPKQKQYIIDSSMDWLVNVLKD